MLQPWIENEKKKKKHAVILITREHMTLKYLFIFCIKSFFEKY
jgi:hypothetical protein